MLLSQPATLPTSDTYNKPRPAIHCRVLPHGKFNNMFSEPLPRNYIYASIRHTLSQFWCMGVKHGPPQSTCTCARVLIDARDTWALRKILRIPYTRHVSNAEVRGTAGCLPLSHLITNRHLQLFGHVARSSPREDHHRAHAPTSTARLEATNIGRPSISHSWLHAIEAALGPRHWTSASRLPGERPLIKMNGDILWTQQRSSGVRYERRKKKEPFNFRSVLKVSRRSNRFSVMLLTNIDETKLQTDVVTINSTNNNPSPAHTAN